MSGKRPHLKMILFDYMYVCACVHERQCPRRSETLGFSGAGLTGLLMWVLRTELWSSATLKLSLILKATSPALLTTFPSFYPEILSLRILLLLTYAHATHAQDVRINLLQLNFQYNVGSRYNHKIT